jgi:O-antigen/teichoic acid export membrane protein
MKTDSSLKRLSRETVYYGVGNALQKFISFFLFPIYARMLTKEDFGAQDIILTAFTIAYSVMALGLDNGAARYYYDTSDEDDRSRLLSSWLWFAVATSVLVTVPLLLFARGICGLVFRTETLSGIFMIAVAGLPLAVVGKIPMLTLRLRFQAKEYSSLSILYVLIVGLCSLILVVVLRLGIGGIFYANLIAMGCQLMAGFVLTRRSFSRRFSFVAIRKMLIFGLPTVPASVSLWVLNSSNRYYLIKFTSLGDIGVFGVSGRISSIVTFFISAFQMAWPMFAFSIMEDRERAKTIFARILKYYSVVASILLVIVSVFAREMIDLLATSRYEAAFLYVPFLSLGTILWGASDIVGIGYSLAKKSYHVTLATLLGAGVNTGLNLLLIPRIGLLGAAVSVSCGFAISFAYSFIAGRYYLAIPCDCRTIAVGLACAVAAVSVSVLLDHGRPVWGPTQLLVKVPVVAVFIGVLVASRIVDLRAWRTRIRSLWSSRSS